MKCRLAKLVGCVEIDHVPLNVFVMDEKSFGTLSGKKVFPLYRMHFGTEKMYHNIVRALKKSSRWNARLLIAFTSLRWWHKYLIFPLYMLLISFNYFSFPFGLLSISVDWLFKLVVHLIICLSLSMFTQTREAHRFTMRTTMFPLGWLIIKADYLWRFRGAIKGFRRPWTWSSLTRVRHTLTHCWNRSRVIIWTS